MNRRELIAKISIIPFGAAAVSFLSACGGGGSITLDNPPVTTNSGNCQANGAKSDMQFSSGHNHPANAVPANDVVTATQKTYTSPADATGHVHSFTLAASHFTTLQSGNSVSLITDPDNTGHTHPVVVSCNA